MRCKLSLRKNVSQVVKQTLLLLAVLICFTAGASAQLVRLGPTNASNGFPGWYQDSTGLVLNACLPNAQEMSDGTCLVTPDQLTNPAAPIVFPSNFPDEFFFWNATSKMNVNGGSALLVLGLEGAFATGPVIPGDQIVFARVRIRIDVPAPGGDYRVIYPYGVETFPGVAPGTRTINFTADVGLAPGDFTAALNGKITTFLRASATAGGDSLPPVVLPGGNTYLTDPAVATTVTGSPFGTNVFRIEGPNIGGQGIDFIETNLFTLLGQVHLAPIPSPVNVTRATYRRDANSSHVDVFATATPSIGAPVPVLSVTASGMRGAMLSRTGIQYFGQPSIMNPQTVPASVLITNSADTPTSFVEADLVDEVQVTAANYDPSTQTLTVTATSGDQITPPTLLALGLGQLDGMGRLSVSVPVPPATVTVVSNRGGRDTRQVVVGTTTVNAYMPIANDDDAGSIPADIPTVINVLANDMPAGGVTPRIIANPLHGSVSVDPMSGSITYTPVPAYSGPDSFTYVNNNGMMDSDVATVLLNVAFINHAPVTNPDTASVSRTTPVTINVLANDSDPDAGDSLDPLTVTIVTPPASGAAAVNTDGSITYSAAADSTGTITFTYTVQDSHQAVSNTAQVSVTIVNPDTLQITQAQFRTRGDWRVRGTASIPGPGNTITIHNGPTLAGPVIGTIAVDNTGAWDFSLKGSRIVPDPTNTISVESTKGGQSLSFPIQITN